MKILSKGGGGVGEEFVRGVHGVREYVFEGGGTPKEPFFIKVEFEPPPPCTHMPVNMRLYF